MAPPNHRPNTIPSTAPAKEKWASDKAPGHPEGSSFCLGVEETGLGKVDLLGLEPHKLFWRNGTKSDVSVVVFQHHFSENSVQLPFQRFSRHPAARGPVRRSRDLRWWSECRAGILMGSLQWSFSLRDRDGMIMGFGSGCPLIVYWTKIQDETLNILIYMYYISFI